MPNYKEALKVNLEDLAHYIEEYAGAIKVDFDRKSLNKQLDFLEGTAYFPVRLSDTSEAEVIKHLDQHWKTGLETVFSQAIADVLGSTDYGVSMSTTAWRELYTPIYYAGVVFSFVTEKVIDEHD